MSSYLPGLNTVRFFAAFNVLYVHFAQREGMGYLPFFLHTDAVTIFFVLSGYLITYRLLLEQKQHGTIHLKAFYIRRELRILPLYYLVAFVGGFILPRFGAPSPSGDALVSIVLMIPQLMYAFEMPPGLLIHLWSIGVEELFYILFPFAISRWPLRRVCLLTIITSTALSIIAMQHSRWIPLLRTMRFECMAVGALAAYAVVHSPRVLAFMHHRVIEGGAFISLMCIGLLRLTPPLYDLTFSILVAVFLVNISTNPRALLRFEWSASKRMGELTYGVYLWHMPVLWACAQLASGVLLLGLTTVVTLILAWVSYRLIEKPILGLRMRFQPAA